MRIECTPRRRTLISLTPLIDVVFILLVFFMLASNFSQLRAIGVTIPAEAGGPAAGEQPSHPPTRVGRRGPSGRPDAHERPVAARVRQFADGRPVLVQPVGDTRLQVLVAVLDRLATIPDVSLARP
jgi:biopolymer transport protein ExbD